MQKQNRIKIHQSQITKHDLLNLVEYVTGTAEPGGGGLGGLSLPTFEEDDIFFVFVLVYGTYKEIKKENKKTKVFSSGYSPKEGWNT